MVSLSSIIFNPNFWIIINILLFSAIIGLIYRHYKTNKTEKIMFQKTQINLDNEIKHAHKLIEENRKKEAVVWTFNNVLRVLGVNDHPSKTYNEILSHNILQLDNYSIKILREMYSLYEKVRFGDEEPSESELTRFFENLHILNRHLIIMEGEKQVVKP